MRADSDLPMAQFVRSAGCLWELGGDGFRYFLRVFWDDAFWPRRRVRW